MATREELIAQSLSGDIGQRQSLINERLAQAQDAPLSIDRRGVSLVSVLRRGASAGVDRNVVSEAGIRFSRGVINTQFSVPGNLLTMAGDITGVDAVRDTGEFLRLAGALGMHELPPSEQRDDKKVREFVGGVFESGPLFGTQVAGSLLGGLPAFVALGIGPAVGDQYIETKELRLAQGFTEQDAIFDATVEALIVGTITGITNIIPAKVIPPNMKKVVAKSVSRFVKGWIFGGAAEATQDTLETVLSDYSLAVKREDSAAINRIGTVSYWKERGFQAGQAGVLGGAGKVATIAVEPNAIARDQAEIIRLAAPEDPAGPLESPADSPTVLAPSAPPEIQPTVTKALDGLDADQRSVAEEAALDVLEDETASDADQQKAAQVVEGLDQSTAPAEDTADGLIPVTFVGEQDRGPNLSPITLVNNERGDTIPFDPKKHKIVGVAESAAEEGTVLPKKFETKPTAAAKKAFLKGIGVDVSRKPQRTVTEKAALLGRLRGMRDVAKSVSARVRKDVKAAVKAAGAAKSKIDKDTRIFVRRLIRSTIVRKNQGRLIRLVENANPKTLENILDEIDLAIATDALDDIASQTESLDKKIKGAKFISEVDRARFRKEVENLKGRAAGAKAFKQVESIDEASESIDSDLTSVAQEFATAVAAQRKIANGAYKNVRAAVDQLLKNISAPAPEPLAEDEPTTTFSKAKILISDIRRLSNVIENIGKRGIDSVLERLMWREMARAHDEHELHMGAREAQLEVAVKSFGFASLSDAFSKLSGQGGKAFTQEVDVTIDGKDVTITMGQVLWFAAIDAETEARLMSGETIVLSEGRKQKGFPITADELDAIRSKIPFELRQLVRAAKAIADQDTTILFETFLELNGREPRRVNNYFRRKRAIQAAEDVGKPKTWRAILVAYNELLGFGKERSSSRKNPIIVEDFLTAILEQISDTSKVIHIAKPTREAASVLFDPEVQTAINQTRGDDMNTALELHMGAASLARANVTKAGKVVRFLSGSLAAAKLGLNTSSMLKQLGGLFRLLPILGFDRMKVGVRNIRSITLSEMTDHSGFFLTRYIRNVVGRFSPIQEAGGKDFGTDKATFSASMDRAVRNFMAGDLKAGFRAMRDAGISTLEFLNFFDGINARVAWAAYKDEIQQLHPEWTEGRQLLWVAEKASDAIRETQNSSSVLDMTTVALATRGKATSAWMLFLSDSMKTPNRIARGIQRGQGIEVVTAELMNSVWSVGVGRGVTLTTAIMVALAIGDEDDIDEAFKRATALDRNALALGLEAVNMIDPLFTPRIIETMAFNRAQVFDSAVGSSINDLVNAGNDLRKSGVALASGDFEKFREKLIKGGVGLALEGGALSGINPADVQMRRFLDAYDRLDEDQQDKLGRGNSP